MSENKGSGNVFAASREYLLMPRCVYDALSVASEKELRVAVYMSANPDSSAKEVASALGYEEAEVTEALAFFRGAAGKAERTSGATSKDKGKGGKAVSAAPLIAPPDYSGEQLGNILKGSTKLSSIVNECQRLLEKIFTSHDTEVYVGVLYDHLGLDPEYILMLTSYCCGLGKKNVRYVEKTAFSLVSQGVDSCEKLEGYIAAKEKLAKAEYRLRKLFGFGERALTPSEKKHFAKYCELPFDLVEYAYEQMIKNIGEVKLGYLTKIVESWEEKGIRTKAQAMAEKKTPSQKSGKGKSFENESFDFDDFLSVAIKNGTKKK